MISDGSGAVVGILGLAVLLGFYFLPTIIAVMRGHRQTVPILLLNLFLGWTLIGWVVALVWSATSPSAPQVVYVQSAPPPPPS